jgi:hypothetical protein
MVGVFNMGVLVVCAAAFEVVVLQGKDASISPPMVGSRSALLFRRVSNGSCDDSDESRDCDDMMIVEVTKAEALVVSSKCLFQTTVLQLYQQSIKHMSKLVGAIILPRHFFLALGGG